jgi:stage II sporulation protein M
LKLKQIIREHMRSNIKRYIFLLLTFTAGIVFGALTVNGLSNMQREEMYNYFNGFLQLFGNQIIDNKELLRASIINNYRIVLLLWILGVSIIGIPFIFVVIGIRGFITGFCAGFVVNVLGINGLLFNTVTLLPVEMIIIPCIIAIGVNGVNFSTNIIKSRSARHYKGGSLKKNLMSYCAYTLFLGIFILAGVLFESYITPIFLRMIAPAII